MIARSQLLQFSLVLKWLCDLRTLAGDGAPSEAALIHTLEHLKATETYEPKLVVFLQCTSPLTSAMDIDGTIAAMQKEGADTAVAVVPFHYFLWERDRDGNGTGVNHDKSVRLLRQERPPEYLEAGAVYVMRAEPFLKAKHRFFGSTTLHEIPASHRWEIDDPVDLQIAELLLRARTREERALLLPEPLEGIVLDFDGVFTDNKVLVFDDGREAVICSRSDGWGLARLRDLGAPLLILSTEENSVVSARARKLRIPCLQGINDKLGTLKRWASQAAVDIANVVYVGNDVNDLACLNSVGCPILVNDAHHDVRMSAKIVLDAPGGEGALRELAELVQQRYLRENSDA